MSEDRFELTEKTFQQTEGANYQAVRVPDEIREKFENKPEILQDIIERYKAAAQFIKFFNFQCSVEGYVIAGSSSTGEGLRPGKFTRRPISFVDLKENFPSDIDVLICVSGDGERAQREAEILARRMMERWGYFVHAHVYTKEGLFRAVEEFKNDDWFSGLKELKEKIS